MDILDLLTGDPCGDLGTQVVYSGSDAVSLTGPLSASYIQLRCIFRAACEQMLVNFYCSAADIFLVMPTKYCYLSFSFLLTQNEVLGPAANRGRRKWPRYILRSEMTSRTSIVRCNTCIYCYLSVQIYPRGLSPSSSGFLGHHLGLSRCRSFQTWRDQCYHSTCPATFLPCCVNGE